MNDGKQLRELTRMLERNLNLINSDDCCTCNISSVECHTLVEIGRKHNAMLKEIASILQVDVSTTSKVVDSLVRKGLILREPSQKDRRSLQLNLSKEGQKVFEGIESSMDQLFQRISNQMSPADHEQLLASIRLYNNAVYLWKENRTDDEK